VHGVVVNILDARNDTAQLQKRLALGARARGLAVALRASSPKGAVLGRRAAAKERVQAFGDAAQSLARLHVTEHMARNAAQARGRQHSQHVK
jgi:hypothetical protein